MVLALLVLRPGALWWAAVMLASAGVLAAELFGPGALTALSPWAFRVLRTRGSSIGMLHGRISGLRSPFSHSEWMTAAISRNTPRVRWNFTSVDQSV